MTARTRQVRDEEPSERVPWRVSQDNRLSYRAAGVLGELLSRPNDWRTNATQLAKGRPEGRDAVETALRELETFGYLSRRRVQYRSGRWGWIWLYGKTPASVAAHADDLLHEMTDELHPTWVAKNLGKRRLRSIDGWVQQSAAGHDGDSTAG